MSAIKVDIAIDNAAFEDDLTGEVRHIFRYILAHLGDLGDEGELPIRDSNGNTVGKAFIGFDHQQTEEPVLDLLWACQECGCTDVQETAWIYMNTGLNSGEDGPQDDPFCPQCGHSMVDIEQTATERTPFDGEPNNLENE